MSCNGKGVKAIAAAALLACATLTRAADPRTDADAPAQTGTAARPVLVGTPPPGRRPFMNMLNDYGLAEPLERNGIDVYGFIEGSTTYAPKDPNRDHEAGVTTVDGHTYTRRDPRHRIQNRMFDHHHGLPAINRFDLFVQNTVDYNKPDFDVGFLVETQYGTDAAMMKSNGLFDFDYGPYRRGHADPEYQFDLTQAYVDLAVPLGPGFRVRAGKFLTLLGYESCDPTTRTSIQFYSRSWLLAFGLPMYQTGVIGTVDVGDSITVNAGVTRGWEQALADNNNALDFLGSVNWVVNDQLSAYFAASVGPQQPGNTNDWRTVLEAILYYTPDPRGRWTFALDTLYGFEDNEVTEWLNASTDDQLPVGSTSWAAVAAFAAYRLSDTMALKARVEWFYDQDGTRFRVPSDNATFTAAIMSNPYMPLGRSYNQVEFTLGMDIVPFPHDAPTLLVRPEARIDVANEDIYVGGKEDYQITLSVDVLYKF